MVGSKSRMTGVIRGEKFTHRDIDKWGEYHVKERQRLE